MNSVRGRILPFPASAGGAAQAPHLPLPRTRLIGRAEELRSIEHLLQRADVGLVTLTGPGGVGKTRLALQVAAELAPAFRDGVVFVRLDSVRDPTLVLSTIAGAFDLGERSGRPLAQQLVTQLQGRQLLLVLDNFEQVVESASLVGELLIACPDLKVLATSRLALRLSDEHIVPVAPLAAPDGTEAPSPEATVAYPAVSLFLERVQAADPGFTLSETNAVPIAMICARLDGLPLALELAAARIRTLPPSALLARLDSALTVLTGGARDQPDRLRTMRSAIAWSYDLLAETDQRLFRRLALFAGGFSLPGATAMLAELHGEVTLSNEEEQALLDGIASLIEMSLLRRASGLPGAEPRYQMLETVRAFGLEQLAASGEEDAARLAHATYALYLATQSQDHVFAPDHLEQLARLESEYDNVRAALDWAAATHGNAELGLRIATALGPFWNFRSHFREGRRWFEHFLSQADDAPLELRAVAQSRAGWLACLQGAAQDAEPLLTAGLRDAVLVGDRWTEGIAQLGLATIHLHQGRLSEAETWNVRALGCFQELGVTTTGAPQYVGVAYYLLGQNVLAQGDTTRAAELLEEAVSRQRALDFDWGLSGALRILGHLARTRGDDDAALVHYRESLELFHKRGDILAMPETLSGIASVAVARGQMERAVRLYAAATALAQEVDIPVAGHERAAYDRGLVEARSALPAEASDAAWAAGSALSLEEMLAEALAVPDPLDRTKTEPVRSNTAAPEHTLTPRERELLPLLAEGLTDREIAAALSISPRTVGYHVTNLLGKLGADSRTAAVAYALRHGLV